jgi:hypothetical protein
MHTVAALPSYKNATNPIAMCWMIQLFMRDFRIQESLFLGGMGLSEKSIMTKSAMSPTH